MPVNNNEKKNRLIRRLQAVLPHANIYPDEPMALHCSMRVGGPCDVMIFPETQDYLVQAYRICLEEEYPVFVTGNGSNIIVRDNGIRAAVIRTHPNLCGARIQDNSIKAECGILLKDLAAIACENDLGGLEFAHGIPGTLGGAVVMNAGAYGGEIKDVCVKTTYLDKDGSVHTLENEAQDFGYRHSRVSELGGVILTASLRLTHKDKKAIKAKMDDLQKRREDKQPLDMPSAGSVFKRPEGYYTGKLIQDCDLKGYNIGGAQISTKHSGFIVNTGNATAQDVIRLIAHIQKTVFERFGIRLETEVRVVGEE